MHRIFESESWRVKMLRNQDGDPDTGREPATGSIDTSLQGCVDLLMQRNNEQYLAEIRLEELEHNALFLVEADVLRDRGDIHEYTNSDVYYFRRRRIQGTHGKAAECAKVYQNQIDQGFFGKKPR